MLHIIRYLVMLSAKKSTHGIPLSLIQAEPGTGSRFFLVPSCVFRARFHTR